MTTLDGLGAVGWLLLWWLITSITLYVRWWWGFLEVSVRAACTHAVWIAGWVAILWVWVRMER